MVIFPSRNANIYKICEHHKAIFSSFKEESADDDGYSYSETDSQYLRKKWIINIQREFETSSTVCLQRETTDFHVFDKTPAFISRREKWYSVYTTVYTVLISSVYTTVEFSQQ
jgi:hypothetical protein